ncbi:MAG: ACT domain protein [Thermoplasmata archaeon]|nr:ACT domain protein [Thermoplasmata archaeon]
MKNWEFGKVQGNKIAIDERLSDMMGIVEGGYVYSTLFEYTDEEPKKYELILSMYPQENYRTLTNITLYMKDVPGSSAQGAKFLGERGINILNSISLDGISDTIIIWKMLADLSFAGELGILKEKFESLKAADDPSVSLIEQLEIKPADIGRVFRTEANVNKTELRRGAPVTLKDGMYDISVEYGDILKDMDGKNTLIVADVGSWIMSVTFFKEKTTLRKISIDIPDCPGSIAQCLSWIAEQGINLISVFSKVKICYQTMTLDLVADFAECRMDKDEFEAALKSAFENMNGIYTLTQFEELE